MQGLRSWYLQHWECSYLHRLWRWQVVFCQVWFLHILRQGLCFKRFARCLLPPVHQVSLWSVHRLCACMGLCEAPQLQGNPDHGTLHVLHASLSA